MSNRGTRRENAVKDWLEEQGWWVCRAAGSLGDADLVALKDPMDSPYLPRPDMLVGNRHIHGGKLLIEVKSDVGNPYGNFRPERRSRLLQAATKAGAQAALCWWPPRGQMTWLWPEGDWPSPRTTVDFSE